jgi:hypothetical protein
MTLACKPSLDTGLENLRLLLQVAENVISHIKLRAPNIKDRFLCALKLKLWIAILSRFDLDLLNAANFGLEAFEIPHNTFCRNKQETGEYVTYCSTANMKWLKPEIFRERGGDDYPGKVVLRCRENASCLDSMLEDYIKKEKAYSLII